MEVKQMEQKNRIPEEDIIMDEEQEAHVLLTQCLNIAKASWQLCWQRKEITPIDLECVEKLAAMLYINKTRNTEVIKNADEFPATDKQIALLQKLNIKFDENTISKRSASELIDKKFRR